MIDLRDATHLAKVDRLQAGEGRRPGSDCRLVLAALMTVLCLIGLVMVLSASSVLSIKQYGSPWYYFLRQAMWLGVGGLAFFVTYRVDYHRWRPLGKLSMAVSLLLLLVVLMPQFGVAGGGSARWIGLGSIIRVQPSELAKLALVLFAADVLDRRADRARDWRYSMTPVLVAFGALALLIMAQPDMGTTVILGCIVLAALFVAGSPLRPLASFSMAGGMAAFMAARWSPYRWQRMTAFLHPFAKANTAGYQSAQSLVALGSGHLLGMGLGASPASTGYLPNQYTDFIYAIIGEETGLLGSLAIAGLFLALAVVGIRIACRAKDRFGAILVAGTTAWLVGQAVVNIGAVVGLLPVTGVPLPFVSYGGSSLIIAMGAVGMCCNVAKQSGLASRTVTAADSAGAGLIVEPAAGRGHGRGRGHAAEGPGGNGGVGGLAPIRPIRTASSGGGRRGAAESGGAAGRRGDSGRRGGDRPRPGNGGRRDSGPRGDSRRPGEGDRAPIRSLRPREPERRLTSTRR